MVYTIRPNLSKSNIDDTCDTCDCDFNPPNFRPFGQIPAILQSRPRQVPAQVLEDKLPVAGLSEHSWKIIYK